MGDCQFPIFLVINFFLRLKATKEETNLSTSIHTMRLTSSSLRDCILAPLIAFNRLVDTKPAWYPLGGKSRSKTIESDQ